MLPQIKSNVLTTQTIQMPDVLYEEVVEVKERLVLEQDSCQLNKQCETVMGTTGEKVGWN